MQHWFMRQQWWKVCEYGVSTWPLTAGFTLQILGRVKPLRSYNLSSEQPLVALGMLTGGSAKGYFQGVRSSACCAWWK